MKPSLIVSIVAIVLALGAAISSVASYRSVQKLRADVAQQNGALILGDLSSEYVNAVRADQGCFYWLRHSHYHQAASCFVEMQGTASLGGMATYLKNYPLAVTDLPPNARNVAKKGTADVERLITLELSEASLAETLFALHHLHSYQLKKFKSLQLSIRTQRSVCNADIAALSKALKLVQQQF